MNRFFKARDNEESVMLRAYYHSPSYRVLGHLMLVIGFLASQSVLAGESSGSSAGSRLTVVPW